MANFLDTFTNTTGTQIVSHTSDSGNTYVGSSDFEIDSGDLLPTAAITSSAVVDVYESDGTTLYQNPSEFDLIVTGASVSGNGNLSARVCGNGSEYVAIQLLNNGVRFVLFEGSYQNLYEQAFSGPDEIKIEVRSGTLEFFIGGVSTFGPVSNSTLPRAGKVSYESGDGGNYRFSSVEVVSVATGPDYTNRKGATLDSVTHGLGTITTATLNAVNVFDHVSSQAAGTISFTGAITDEITTSGEYDLVLGDGVGTETYTVQVNVVGLASFNINKDGADQASLTDVEFVVMTGAAGSRVIADQITGVTTDVNGDTGAIEVPAVSLNVDDTVLILQQSATVGGGLPHSATLVAI